MNNKAYGLKIVSGNDKGVWLSDTKGFLINYAVRAVAVAHANKHNKCNKITQKYDVDVEEFTEEEVYRERSLEELEKYADEIFGTENKTLGGCTIIFNSACEKDDVLYVSNAKGIIDPIIGTMTKTQLGEFIVKTIQIAQHKGTLR